MSTPASMTAEQLAAVRGMLNDPAISITLDGRGWLRAITPVPPIVVFGGLVVIPQTPREALLFDPFLPARVEPDGARLRETKRAARHARYVAEARAEHAAWRQWYRAKREREEGLIFGEEMDVETPETPETLPPPNRIAPDDPPDEPEAVG